MRLQEGDTVRHKAGGCHLTVVRVEGQPPDDVKVWVTAPDTGDHLWWVEAHRIEKVRKHARTH